MKAPGYHAHVYFDAREESRALEVRSGVHERFGVPVGTVHRQPVGPHTKAMFQILISTAELGEVLFWLMQHRGELSVLIHGDTGDDYVDHTQHVAWLGEPVKINLDLFRPVRA